MPGSCRRALVRSRVVDVVEQRYRVFHGGEARGGCSATASSRSSRVPTIETVDVEDTRRRSRRSGRLQYRYPPAARRSGRTGSCRPAPERNISQPARTPTGLTAISRITTSGAAERLDGGDRSPARAGPIRCSPARRPSRSGAGPCLMSTSMRRRARRCARTRPRGSPQSAGADADDHARGARAGVLDRLVGRHARARQRQSVRRVDAVRDAHDVACVADARSRRRRR